MTLRFSVIIPTLNRRHMLRSALASVRAQHWPNVEIIVVDGGSNDGTLQELESHGDVRLIRGPDRGVYDAWNKGIARAEGDIIGILNSDDCYEPGAFAAVASAMTDAVLSVCGTALLVENDRVVTRFDNAADKSLASPRTTLIGSCAPNARFFRRSAMAKVGAFSLDYKYVSDRDWLTRWYEAGLVTAAIPNVVYRYQQHPGSLTFDADRRGEIAIRAELVQLARHWRKTVGARDETRHCATMLEGRCRAYLAIRAAREGRFEEIRCWLIEADGHASMGPLAAIVSSGPDWMIEALKRRWRSRPVRCEAAI
jgi:glycosyltransferase involved in cell wall biosynthesis